MRTRIFLIAILAITMSLYANAAPAEPTKSTGCDCERSYKMRCATLIDANGEEWGLEDKVCVSRSVALTLNLTDLPNGYVEGSSFFKYDNVTPTSGYGVKGGKVYYVPNDPNQTIYMFEYDTSQVFNDYNVWKNSL